jgi:hypothetical protein
MVSIASGDFKLERWPPKDLKPSSCATILSAEEQTGSSAGGRA